MLCLLASFSPGFLIIILSLLCGSFRISAVKTARPNTQRVRATTSVALERSSGRAFHWEDKEFYQLKPGALTTKNGALAMTPVKRVLVVFLVVATGTFPLQ